MRPKLEDNGVKVYQADGTPIETLGAAQVEVQVGIRLTRRGSLEWISSSQQEGYWILRLWSWNCMESTSSAQVGGVCHCVPELW